MKCPRCSGELGENECSVCHLAIRRRRKVKLPPIVEKFWEVNLEFYRQTRPIMVLLGLITMVLVISTLIEMFSFLIAGFVIWFMLMVFYDTSQILQEKKKKKKVK